MRGGSRKYAIGRADSHLSVTSATPAPFLRRDQLVDAARSERDSASILARENELLPPSRSST